MSKDSKLTQERSLVDSGFCFLSLLTKCSVGREEIEIGIGVQSSRDAMTSSILTTAPPPRSSVCYNKLNIHASPSPSPSPSPLHSSHRVRLHYGMGSLHADLAGRARARASEGKQRKPYLFLHHLIASTEGVEKTYIMIKPDGVQRGLVGDIISRFERKGFVLKGLKLFQCPTELAEEHYRDLKSKPFFPKVVKYITSGPVVCMAWEGPGVVAAARKLIGVTNPLEAEPGTIRGDFATAVGRNVIHGSDSKENGEREVDLWFKKGELCEWVQELTPWLRE